MNARGIKDVIGSRLMLSVTVFSTLVVLVMAFVLLNRSVPILMTEPLSDLLLSSSWHPSKGEFGFFPFIVGTLLVTGLAMLLSVPPSLLASIYLAEYASDKVRRLVKPMIDLLAGIPSVIFGLWGTLLVVPLISYVAPITGVTSTGYSMLAGGLVLSIMVSPIMISVSEEVLRTVPLSVREASLALGATKWETSKYVVVRSAFPGIVAAVILGFGRAFGETIAVLMVVGNVPRVPSSLFDPAYPLPALIANNYGEMMSLPMYDSALMLAALLLFTIVLISCVSAGAFKKAIEGRYRVGQA